MINIKPLDAVTFDFFLRLYYTCFSWVNRGLYLSIPSDRRDLLDYSGLMRILYFLPLSVLQYKNEKE